MFAVVKPIRFAFTALLAALRICRAAHARRRAAVFIVVVITLKRLLV